MHSCGEKSPYKEATHSVPHFTSRFSSCNRMRFSIVLFACFIGASAKFDVNELENILKEHTDIDKLKEFLKNMSDKIAGALENNDKDEKELKERLADIGTYTPPKGLKKDGEDVTEINEEAGLDGELFEGDILLADWQIDNFQITNPRYNGSSRARRQAQTGPRFPSNTWGTKPLIPYSFASGYPSSRIPSITGAIKFWESKTCIRFQQGGSGSDRVQFINDNGCYSYVGRIGGTQKVSIGQGCEPVGTVAHELSHTFGIYHVQSRYDRDQYVLVNTRNIDRSKLNNFDIESQQSTNNYNIPYEFGSNMHYGQSDFGLDRSQPALVARGQYSAYQNSMQGRLPTFYDILLVNTYYNCNKCSSKISCQNGGVQDVNNCNVCLCPNGYAGATCNQFPAGTTQKTLTTSPQSFFAQAGNNQGTEKLDFDNAYFVLTAPAGKRVELTTKQVAGVTSTNCYIGGAEVKFTKDPRMSGIKICDPKFRQAPIISEGNQMIINVYNRYYSSQFEFSARAV